MKKFLALLIFAGLTSAGFAKSAHASEIKNQSYVNEYQQSQKASINYASGNSQNVYANSEASYIRGGEYDSYRHDRWGRHHRHDRRHRHEHRRFHREHYY